MKKRQRVKIKRDLAEFSQEYVITINKILDSFEQIQEEIRKSVPSIFNSNKLNIETFYSENRNHVMILFQEAPTNNKTTFRLINDNIFDVLDSTGIWKSSGGSAFRFENSSGIIDSCNVQGTKPFEIFGDSKIILSNFKYNLPNGLQKEIPFGFIFSLNHFTKIKSDLIQFTENQIYSYWDYYRTSNKKLDTGSRQEEYKIHINNILTKMEKIFYDDEVDEKTIDDFITNNPIILERCLDINPDSLLPQVKLINEIKENFEQNMIPDLMCKNIHNEWIILDYKRAKRIVKKEGTARQDVTSEVHDLKTQLKTYREFFNDTLHRESFFEKTGYRICSKPQAIGLIGIIKNEEQKIFKDSIEDYPNWLQIETYDRIYTKFKYFYNNLF